MSARSRIAVLGAGAWGTALALNLAQKHDVALWTRDPAQVASLRAARENVRYLPGFQFPPALSVVGDLASALAGARLALSVVPTAGFRQLLRQIDRLAPSLPVLAANKGLEAGSGCLPHRILADEHGGTANGALSGPSFAQEVARGQPAALTLASRDAAFGREAAALLHSARLRIYTSDDVAGVEIGGAVKNVMAIAAGISDGLGFGLNARAALLTRGLAEISRLGQALGARAETLMGLSGAGDLILTCTGDLSRNRQVGLKLAEGLNLRQILDTLGHVAEGVHTALEVRTLAARLGVDMPITDAVCRIVHDGRPAREVVSDLLSRAPGAELR